MNKKETEIYKFKMHLKKFFVCALVFSNYDSHNFCLKARSENGWGK